MTKYIHYKVTFNCDVLDGTRTILVTMFNNDQEKLFKMPVEDIFMIKETICALLFYFGLTICPLPPQ